MDFLTGNWDGILVAIASIIATASVIAKLTPTEVDDNFIGKLVKLMDVLGLNNKPTTTK